MLVEIPRGKYDEDEKPNAPCWIPIQDKDGKPCKPLIKCNCGKVCGIGLHHVHVDGTVTASFYHAEVSTWTAGGKTYTHEPGCGWHVYLKLKDYDQGDFPGEP